MNNPLRDKELYERGAGDGDPKQLALLDAPQEWELHWVGMPEFVQEDLSPSHSITIHFLTTADFDAFCRLINQTLKHTDKSAWYPEQAIGTYADKRYADE